MKNEFALAFNELLEEKQLPREIILSAIESAMVSAYRKAVNASNNQEIKATLDLETGKVTIFAEKEVVEDVQDERTEVILENARKVNPEAQLGDLVIVETTPKDFGRVAAQAARQMIQQRIREAERKMQADFFVKQVNEIVSGVVQAINMTQGATIGLDMKAEGIMPPNQKIPGERFKIHDRIRAIVQEVKDTPRGPQIILSRSHRNFLRRLLENEVPEIYHGIVEIRAISREPGQRAKVAVSATQPNVDPVGACVGIKGVRIQAIVKELHDEKIDIIEWNPDPVLYISKAISPAKVSGVYLNENEKTATVVVMEDQLSLAIGRDGQNARLAAKLTGWRIDIKSLTEASGDAIIKLQTNPELSVIAEIEKDHIPAIEAILAKKAENRPVTPEEYSMLIQFVDRVEKRTIEKQKAEAAAEEERIMEARKDIPAAAFEMELATLNLREHINSILLEAKYLTVGDLMLVIKLDADSILGLPGIGPKALQAIQAAIGSVPFPEPEIPVEVPEPVVEELPVPEVISPITEETPISEGEPVIEPQVTGVEETPATEEPEPEEEEKDFEKLFTLQNVIAQVPVTDEEEEGRTDKKDAKKKGRKDRVIEFDEESGQAVAHKKHKRDDGTVDIDW
jgi:transcription termination/antitermination protein NusA